MGNRFWIMLETDYLRDEDFIELPEITKWHFIGMYLLAKDSDANGILASKDKALTPKGIARLLFADHDEIMDSIRLLVSAGFMVNNNGILEIAKYSEEQESKLEGEVANKKKEQNKKRQQEHREKIKINKQNLETKKETKKETEIDKQNKKQNIEVEIETETEEKRDRNVTERDVTRDMRDRCVTDEDEQFEIIEDDLDDDLPF